MHSLWKSSPEGACVPPGNRSYHRHTPRGTTERRSGTECGCSSGVEHNLAKVGVVGSNPIARSNQPSAGMDVASGLPFRANVRRQVHGAFVLILLPDPLRDFLRSVIGFGGGEAANDAGPPVALRPQVRHVAGCAISGAISRAANFGRRLTPVGCRPSGRLRNGGTTRRPNFGPNLRAGDIFSGDTPSRGGATANTSREWRSGSGCAALRPACAAA